MKSMTTTQVTKAEEILTMTEECKAALVQQGTTTNQRVFTGTLETLAQRIAQEQVQAPTLLIVGEVVQLREKLAWFEGAQASA